MVLLESLFVDGGTEDVIKGGRREVEKGISSQQIQGVKRFIEPKGSKLDRLIRCTFSLVIKYPLASNLCHAESLSPRSDEIMWGCLQGQQ